METIEYKGIEIEIIQDEHAESPRAWDNLGKMICFHRDYILGDEHKMTPEELKNSLKEIVEAHDVEALPIYAYEHGGITINTSGFSCPWDSGQVGYIYVTHRTIIKEYGRLNAETIEKARRVLQGEVETLDQYLTGDVWGYNIPEFNESCWGYYGQEDAIEEAKSIVNYCLEERRKKKQERLKQLIKAGVPAEYRRI